jgi:hypothetical protein
MQGCNNLLRRIKVNDEWLNLIITVDENWGFQRDPETKRQIPGSPRSKKGRMSKSE